MARIRHLRIIPLTIKNKGLDVGPFLLALWHMQHCHYRYEYIAKTHFKRVSHPVSWAWTLAAMTAPDFLRPALALLDADPSVSAVYPQTRHELLKTIKSNHRHAVGPG